MSHPQCMLHIAWTVAIFTILRVYSEIFGYQKVGRLGDSGSTKRFDPVPVAKLQ